ncbi:MAG: metallopeptidase TldD-related protein [Sphingopyxis sp.]|uniref:TldD/PmbA family protein n=1 Tax=Sphingopyxis sp. TaxID=1908224 RepID=UPI0032EE9956
MLTVSEALDRAQMLCDAATKAGADAADALYYCNAATSVTMRLGALEDVERSEGQDISLRAFVGDRSASVSTADMDAGELAKLVERCVAMAREAPEDPYAGLAPEELLFKGPVPDLDLDDASEADPAALREVALAVEDTARAIPGVTNSEGGSASHSRTRFALATSHGFAGGYGASGHSLSASVIAGEGAAMQRDYAWHSAHHLTDLESPTEIGARAGARAVARLNPGKAPNAKLPVFFDPRVSGGIIGHLLAAIAGPAIARGTSFLLGKEKDKLFDSSILIRDEPHRLRGLRSRAFDGEGLPTAARDIVVDGKITGWLLDSASARQLGLTPTGHASRGGGASGVAASNLHLAAGTQSPAELMADVGEGVYITELIGHGVNPVTGDYSRGASGFLIRDGVVAGPIAEFTVAGNLVDMFAALVPASDLHFRHATNAPTLRIDGMTVASS